MSKARAMQPRTVPGDVRRRQSASSGNESATESEDDDPILRLATVRSNTQPQSKPQSSTTATQSSAHSTDKRAAEKAAAREEWEDKFAAKQEKRYAGRSEAGKLVTVKQERQRAARDAETASGISGALQQLKLKKQQKERLKKLKKKKQLGESDDVHDSENDSDEEKDNDNDSDVNAPDDSADDAGNGNDDDEAPDASDSQPIHYASIEEQVAAYREEHNISLTHSLSFAQPQSHSQSLTDDARFFPVLTFHELRTQFVLEQSLLAAFPFASFKAPTPIQSQVWPIILSGWDVVGVAETGSGKTLAFALGAIVYALRQCDTTSAAERATGTPYCLILAPTRELATQIFTVIETICQALGLHSLCLTGGPSIEGQSLLLSQSAVDIVVATPGRLVKLVGSQSLSLSLTGYFVLDEADRMLDLGFTNDLNSIIAALTHAHQTLLFSATFPPTMADIATKFVRNDRVLRVTIGSIDLAAAKSVTQIAEVIDRRNGRREKRLLELLAQFQPTASNLVIVFVLYKREAQTLSDYINKHSGGRYQSVALHSDKTQQQRIAALTSFKSGQCPVLVATDVAARGLDVRAIHYVVNFSMGLSVEHYIHRIGRCGRGGNRGTAVTFVVDYDLPHIHHLLPVLIDSGVVISDELRELAERSERRALKHREESGVTGDALFAVRQKNKQRHNNSDDDDAIEAKIFGEESEAASGQQRHQSGRNQRSRSKQAKKHGRHKH